MRSLTVPTAGDQFGGRKPRRASWFEGFYESWTETHSNESGGITGGEVFNQFGMVRYKDNLSALIVNSIR
jgi:hypothetical protein